MALRCGVARMRSRQRMFAAVMRLLLKCLRLGRRRRFKLVRQVEQLWHYGHLCLRSLFYNSFTNGDVVLDSLFEPVYWLVDHVTRWFGVVFVALVISLTSSIVAIVYICLLPLILQTYTPAWICWHLAYGHWNLIMIIFHYYMAITTSPGHPPQEMHRPQASSHSPLQHLQQVRTEDGPPLPLAKQLCGTLQPPLLLFLLPVHDHGMHLLQHQRLGDVPGRLRGHRDVLPDPAAHLLLPPASFPQECGLPLGPLQLSCVGPGCPHTVARCPHNAWGNQHREAHQQEGEAEAAEERQGLQEPLQLWQLGQLEGVLGCGCAKALGHPCPASLPSPASWDGPELGPASLCDQAAHPTPGHLKPGCCHRLSLQAGECRGDPLWYHGSPCLKSLVEDGCWHASLPGAGARATGSSLDSVGAWMPALLAFWWLPAAPGEGRQCCSLPWLKVLP
ncbi:palmitoyltransferase ZDHHC16 isoform X6 [Cuculus canorus]|uniref:palmitoyltransferase ZDHHC16 isoform X6 n=1 Tax=Cuculus canorus TaxID=55661 RepID=UPI0023AA3371|nr:palmitoyltransferase ZDHHC16 isoform X6 [Cuculus canorus]